MEKSTKIVKEKNYETFNVQIKVQIVISTYHNQVNPFSGEVKDRNYYSVVYSVNGASLESYDVENYNFAERDYNTICDTIRNVLNVIKQASG